MYGTGLGQTVPLGIDGAITGNDVPVQTLPTTARFGVDASSLVGAEVLYAGPAPGLVSGVFQINARIPGNSVSGPNLLQLRTSFQSATITVFVQ
jgi:uncharacterized protein (TIGR03437 family)